MTAHLSCHCGVATAHLDERQVWGMFVCHCSMCPAADRRATWSSGAPWVAVPRVSFRSSNGSKVQVRRSSSFASRGACGNCSSSLFIQYDCEVHTTWVHADLMPKSWVPVKVHHIHCCSTESVEDGWPCHPAYEPWEPDPCRPACAPLPRVCRLCFQLQEESPRTCNCSVQSAASCQESDELHQESSARSHYQISSEVHLRVEKDDGDGHVTTRYIYAAMTDCSGDSRHSGADSDSDNEGISNGSPSHAATDGDGDLLLPRKRRRRGMPQNQRRGGFIELRHSLSTTLDLVGLQVWKSALLTCDWLLAPSNEAYIRDATVLDLGAGTGLTSIAACLAGARTIFCTDSEHVVLENLQRNVYHAWKRAVDGSEPTDVFVRKLDWYTASTGPEGWPLPPIVTVAGRELNGSRTCCGSGSEQSEESFLWHAPDANRLARCKLILAADCVYDDDATNALLETVSRLLAAMPDDAMALFCLERRINFCLNGLRARAPAAEHFASAVGARVSNGEWTATRLDASCVPQCFEYERGRTEMLELWQVQKVPVSGNN